MNRARAGKLIADSEEGVRLMCCREATGSDFRQAAEDLERVGQIALTHEMLRRVVEGEGRQALAGQQAGWLAPTWTAADCRGGPGEPTCVLTGADGVKVPLVAEAEKAKRRALRRGRGPRSCGRRKADRPRVGSSLQRVQARDVLRSVA